jgi:hypothetical protein
VEAALAGSTQAEFEQAVLAAQILEARGELEQALVRYRALIEREDVDESNEVLLAQCREHLELVRAQLEDRRKR